MKNTCSVRWYLVSFKIEILCSQIMFNHVYCNTEKCAKLKNKIIFLSFFSCIFFFKFYILLGCKLIYEQIENKMYSLQKLVIGINNLLKEELKNFYSEFF